MVSYRPYDRNRYQCTNNVRPSVCVLVICLLLVTAIEFSTGQVSLHLTISTVLVEPYTMFKLNNQSSTYTNDDFYGFIPDVISWLSRTLRFSYDFKSAGTDFGMKLSNGEWTGMIGHVIRKEAQIAAGPLFITKPRQKAVRFTRPFLRTGASILLRRPPPGQPLGIQNVRDLLTQNELKYGTLDVGMIKKAFQSTNNSLYRRLWRRMADAEPSVFTNSNAEGINRVRTEKYVFILPSTIADYIIRRKPCDLTSVGRFLINRGFALAVGKDDYSLKKTSDSGIDSMQKQGQLDYLYRKWWIHKGECDDIKPQGRRRVLSSDGTMTRCSDLLVTLYTVTLLSLL